MELENVPTVLPTGKAKQAQAEERWTEILRPIRFDYGGISLDRGHQWNMVEPRSEEFVEVQTRRVLQGLYNDSLHSTATFKPLINTLDFAMDPGQELLALVEKPVRSDVCSFPVTVAYLSLRVSGDFLGILFVAQGKNTPELAVWNWKPGELILASQIVAESTLLPVALISTPETTLMSGLDMGSEAKPSGWSGPPTVVKDKTFVKTKRTRLPYCITAVTLPPPLSPGEGTIREAMGGEDGIFLVLGSDPNLVQGPSVMRIFFTGVWRQPRIATF
ncbi:hypothetical protein BDR05DRAFT_953668 [Suillus weaverae]|nr:hypothetical protein BDR05DRAFT_953668 [Suillus weaverae]